jgi:hypothetical protein
MVLLLLLSYYSIILNLENPKPQSPLRHNPHWDPPVQPKIYLGNTKDTEESTRVVTKSPRPTGFTKDPSEFSLVISSGCLPSITGKEKRSF